MPVNVGPGELLLVLVIALIVLGPKRLPDAGRALGTSIRNFKSGLVADPPQATEELPQATEEKPQATEQKPAGSTT
jgi:sec-independent protein translocase protein TatA